MKSVVIPQKLYYHLIKIINEIKLIYHILHTNYPFQLHRSNSVVFSHVIMRVIVFSTTIFAPKDEYISAN